MGEGLEGRGAEGQVGIGHWVRPDSEMIMEHGENWYVYPSIDSGIGRHRSMGEGQQRAEGRRRRLGLILWA